MRFRLPDSLWLSHGTWAWLASLFWHALFLATIGGWLTRIVLTPPSDPFRFEIIVPEPIVSSAGNEWTETFKAATVQSPLQEGAESRSNVLSQEFSNASPDEGNRVRAQTQGTTREESAVIAEDRPPDEGPANQEERNVLSQRQTLTESTATAAGPLLNDSTPDATPPAEEKNMEPSRSRDLMASQRSGEVPFEQAASTTQSRASEDPSSVAGQVPIETVTTDYSWLRRVLMGRLHALGRESRPVLYHLGRVKVLIRAAISEQGHLAELSIETSSGYTHLDHEAMKLVERAFPLPLEHELGRSQIVMRIPITYSAQ